MGDKLTINGKIVNFCGLLGLLFIHSKLAGHVDWEWLWVTSPLWGIYGLAVILDLAQDVVKWADQVFGRNKYR